MLHPYGWLSLLPPIVAIVLAIATRRVVLSLLVGVLSGGLILTGGDPLAAIALTVEDLLWESFVSRGTLAVFAFTLLMGAMVGMINRCGGMQGLVDAISPWARNRRRGQLTTWFLGLFIFFDDYANTLLLGNTLRPLCDRLRISREKLAYLVDSTAAPVSGLALVSTWVAVEISYVQQGLDKVPAAAEWDAFLLFVRSIPYRFYVLWALMLVPIIAWLGRDFGPMLAAERDPENSPGRRALSSAQLADSTQPDPRTSARWINAVAPVLITVVAIVGFLYASGRAAIGDTDPSATPSLMQIFGEADPSTSLVWGSLLGVLATAALVMPQRLMSFDELLLAARAGAGHMVPALAILWSASALSTMTGNNPLEEDARSAELQQVAATAAGVDSSQALEEEGEYPYRRYRLYTGAFLIQLLEHRLWSPLLPTAVFLLSSAIAFATGTSFGTMGIVMPLVIPLTYAILQTSGVTPVEHDPILVGTVAAVLAGAIFGDHCSPISDTTVLSSQASGCEHVAHVWTQLPYALLVAVVTVTLGTLPAGFGVSPWILLPTGFLVLVAAVLVLGKKV